MWYDGLASHDAAQDGGGAVTATARFTQGDIQRALKAARKSGYEEVRVRIDAAGQIEIIAGKAANDSPPVVELD